MNHLRAWRSLTSAFLLLWVGISFGVPNANLTGTVFTSETVHFFSKALNRETTYVAFLPEAMRGADAVTSYPVLYLLHGAYGSYRDWPEQTSLTQELARVGSEMIVITPDGGQFGWYVDSPLLKDSNYETFITRDLIADVDSRYPTINARDPRTTGGRGIAGLSMGGNGAITLAAKHRKLFDSASSLSGIFRLQNHPGKWRLNETLGDPAANAAEWAEHDACSLADRFTSGGVAIMFDCGTSDSTNAVWDNRYFHEELTNRGIVHAYREFPGDHTWKYWSEHLPEHLQFHAKVFADRAAGKPQPTGQHIKDKAHQLYVNRTLGFERENATTWIASGSKRPIVLLGSSSIHIIKTDQLFPGYRMANRGISSDVIGLGDRGVLHRLECSVFELNPRAVFILNGTNDLGSTSRSGKPTVEEIARCFGEVVQRIRKRETNAQIFIVSCTPTRGNSAKIAPFIPQYNALLRRLTEAGDSKIRYVDTYSDTVGADGLVKENLSKDGLHLNAEGYQILKRKFIDAMDAAGIKPQD